MHVDWNASEEQRYYPIGLAHQDDFLESNVRLVLWRVAERLVADEAFKPLTLASPFIVGYEFHDGEDVVLRILNWPAGAPVMRSPNDGQ
jgi:hypothetical protein